jgi:hypothetical protein
MPNQLVIKGAGLPGAPDSYYSAEKSLVVTGPRTLVPEIGWILVVAVSGVSYTLQTDDGSPPIYTTVLPANLAGCLWSDGSNLYATASSGTALYFVLAHKP